MVADSRATRPDFFLLLQSSRRRDDLLAKQQINERERAIPTTTIRWLEKKIGRTDSGQRSFRLLNCSIFDIGICLDIKPGFDVSAGMKFIEYMLRACMQACVIYIQSLAS